MLRLQDGLLDLDIACGAGGGGDEADDNGSRHQVVRAHKTVMAAASRFFKVRQSSKELSVNVAFFKKFFHIDFTLKTFEGSFVPLFYIGFL